MKQVYRDKAGLRSSWEINLQSETGWSPVSARQVHHNRVALRSSWIIPDQDHLWSGIPVAELECGIPTAQPRKQMRLLVWVLKTLCAYWQWRGWRLQVRLVGPVRLINTLRAKTWEYLYDVEKLRKKHLCLLNCVCLCWKQVIRKIQASWVTRSYSGTLFIFLKKQAVTNQRKIIQ